MFGIGAPELLVICVVALIFIGPKRLPEVARTVGKGYRELQRALSGVQNEFDSAKDAVNKEAKRYEEQSPKKQDDKKDS